MDSWPITLQQKLETTGFEKRLGNTTVASDMNIGPAKVRSRYTDGVDVYSCQITLDFAEMSVWETFYKQTLVNGTLPFLFVDPFTEVESVFRFVPGADPTVRPLGGRVFTLSMIWEKMP